MAEAFSASGSRLAENGFLEVLTECMMGEVSNVFGAERDIDVMHNVVTFCRGKS